MVAFLYLLLFFVAWVLSYKKFRITFNIVTIFTGLWCLFGALSTFGLYGMRVPALRVHLYACLFVCIVDIVLLLLCKQHSLAVFPSENEREIRTKTQEAENEGTYAVAIQVVALVFYLPMIINAVQAVFAGGLTAVRNAYFSTKYENAYVFSLLCKTMPTSFMTGLIVHYMYKAFENKRWKYFVYAFMNAVLTMLVNGGRYALMQVLLSAVVIMGMKQRPTERDAREDRVFRRKIKKGIAIVAAVMLLVTVFRNQEIIKNIVVYFSGSFSFLDYIIDHPGDFGLNARLFGYLTFGCITEPIVLGLKVLGLTTAKTPSYLFNIVGQTFYNIGEGATKLFFNNNTTVLYYFLRDFGAFGIVIGGLFLASILAFSYNRWLTGSRFHALLYTYMAVILLNSVMTYQLFACGPVFSVIAMYYCCKRAKIRLTVGDRPRLL